MYPFILALPFICMKQFAETFYKSKAWQECRNSYLKSVGGLCEDCYREGRVVSAEEVHHIKWITPQNINDPSVTLAWNNLVALCREHHRQRHGARQTRYKVDEFGRVTPR